MGDNTKIEWADASWSPITGCTKISEGCQHCYAERMARRLAGRFGYPEVPRHFDVTMHEDKMDQPLRWKKPRRIFVCSMGDLFHEGVSFESIDCIFEVMAFCPQHTFLVLTKRPARMRDYFRKHKEIVTTRIGFAPLAPFQQRALPNVWLGVSAENQERADERIPILLQTPAAGHFVNLEPMLGRVDLGSYLRRRCSGCGAYRDKPCTHIATGETWPSLPALSWCILGGESGPGARPLHPDWARSVRDQCQGSGRPFLFKGWGAWVPTETFDNWAPPQPNRPDSWVDHFGVLHQEFAVLIDGLLPIRRVGKKAAGHLLDGREWNDYPEVAQ